MKRKTKPVPLVYSLGYMGLIEMWRARAEKAEAELAASRPKTRAARWNAVNDLIQQRQEEGEK